MIDWRILAASVGALVVVSSIFIGGIGGNFFPDILDNLSDWLGSSPFGGFFSSPNLKTYEVDITLYPDEISLEPDLKINLSSDDTKINDFKGVLKFNFNEQKIFLEETGTSLKFELPLKNIEIDNLKLNSFFIDNINLRIAPDIISENGSVQLQNFYGKLTVTSESMKFKGNVSKIIAKIGSNTWKLE